MRNTLIFLYFLICFISLAACVSRRGVKVSNKDDVKTDLAAYYSLEVSLLPGTDRLQLPSPGLIASAEVNETRQIFSLSGSSTNQLKIVYHHLSIKQLTSLKEQLINSGVAQNLIVYREGK